MFTVDPISNHLPDGGVLDPFADDAIEFPGGDSVSNSSCQDFRVKTEKFGLEIVESSNLVLELA